MRRRRRRGGEHGGRARTVCWSFFTGHCPALEDGILKGDGRGDLEWSTGHTRASESDGFDIVRRVQHGETPNKKATAGGEVGSKSVPTVPVRVTFIPEKFGWEYRACQVQELARRPLRRRHQRPPKVGLCEDVSLCTALGGVINITAPVLCFCVFVFRVAAGGGCVFVGGCCC